MRVGIVALLQESNTFLDRPTTLEDFEREVLVEGEEVRERFAGAHHEVDGFFRGLDAAGLEAVPIFAARAWPFGPMTRATYDALLNRMMFHFDRAGPLDGLLVAPHGANVAEGVPDLDGHWIGQLRRRVGPDTPIIGTLDLHANVSRALVEACDALVAYRTNPHLDQRARGLEAADLMARTLRGEVRPTMAAEFPPMAVNIEAQATAEEPCRSLYEAAELARSEPGVLSISLVLGFPYADVPQMGPAVLAVTDADPVGAGRVAAKLAGTWWERRAEFRGHLVGVEAAVDWASNRAGPVCLLDMGDNVGGGSPGDGTTIAHALRARGLGPSFVCLHDPNSVQAATQAGPGARLQLSVGGKSGELHGPPLEGEFTVRSLHDGKFTESEARHGGISKYDQGPSAVVEDDGGLTILINSRRVAPMSLNQIISTGLDPSRFRVLVAKGVHAPVAAYAPICRDLIRVDTPGVTSADLRRFEYHHRRSPMDPFEPETRWHPSTPQAEPRR
ncbi:M81 family metallopeptidase [Tundrisphaera lichenicola]|uniref:M81 family metallopeptidase n=1 Tax=Tundrisphaera lichenicola TaxID=2029860 RepID=UPI003EC0DE6E